jgi:hypothetical protein
MEKLSKLSQEELLNLLKCYDEYIQQANDDDSYKGGWQPVCISEFYDCEYQEWEELQAERENFEEENEE